MIIIEGPDGVGKSTLAKALQRQLKTSYVHFGPLPDWWKYHDYLTRAMTHAVYDRYHWSCYAYAGVAPQPLEMTPQFCRELDLALRIRAKQDYATILIISGSGDFYKKNSQRDDAYFTHKQIVSVNKKFLEVPNYFDIVWDVDTGWPEVNEVVKLINEVIMKRTVGGIKHVEAVSPEMGLAGVGESDSRRDSQAEERRSIPKRSGRKRGPRSRAKH